MSIATLAMEIMAEELMDELGALGIEVYSSGNAKRKFDWHRGALVHPLTMPPDSLHCISLGRMLSSSTVPVLYNPLPGFMFDYITLSKWAGTARFT